ncbi:hypothetical protein WR25_07965 [Diploscapter pachys]|uniref:EGF-like domain-containing protein n=1 Tax=Diploscapter pachys TaxID=2018661 RepID=A0A2A2KP22_9BILA|nr:hypothetical protein WR25_07965 [Diploscapter pachys]
MEEVSYQHQLYLSSESGPNRLESLDRTIFNARVFASSHQTTLFSFVQDELADFGYFYMQSDMLQTAVASPIGFPSLPIGMAYRLLTSSGNILSNYLHVSKRDPETTTFPFVFEPITDCPPGPLSQLIFIFEQNKQIEEFASIMGGTMNQIVRSVNSSIQNVQYSLLSFDSDNVRVLMSTYDGVFFQRTFCSVITNLTFYPNSSGRPLRVQDAVDSAIKISILSPAIIHLFSYRSSLNAVPKRFYGLIPKDVQLNFYSAYPTTELIRSISQANKELLYLQRQSSGRYRPIRTEATPPVSTNSSTRMVFRLSDSRQPASSSSAMQLISISVLGTSVEQQFNESESELCDQKVCQNGGTPSNGICICEIGYIGQFCENVVVPSNATFSTLIPPNSFPTTPSVTPEHTTPSGSQMIIPSVTLLCGCIILTLIHNFMF